MDAVLTRLIALLLASGALVAVTGAPASAACEHPNASLEQQTKRADAVFTGTVGSRAVDGPAVTYTVDVELVHKGDVGEEATVETTRRKGSCGLPDLAEGDELVWFAASDGDRLRTTADSGTTRATPAHVRQVEDLLGAGTSPTPPVPAEATFTRVGGETTPVSRMVAPGAAMVLVGLLGLLLVAAVGRRRS